MNDEASPVTATLQIDQVVQLTVTTAIELGAGTGAGGINQSAGTSAVTVDAGSLTVNSSGTGELSQINLSGGTLNTGTVDVNAVGEIYMTGGTFNLSGLLTISDGGVVRQAGGTMTCTQNENAIAIKAGGLLEISGGTHEQASRLDMDPGSSLWIIGDDGGLSWTTIKAYVNHVDFIDDGTRYPVEFPSNITRSRNGSPTRHCLYFRERKRREAVPPLSRQLDASRSAVRIARL